MADNFNISDVGGGGGVTTYLGLTDTPGSYAGAAGLVASVNGAETAMEFTAKGASSFLGLSDTPGSYAGQSGHPVRVNTAASALEFVNLTTLNRFGANDAVFPASSPAGTTNRNDHSLITFDDSTPEFVLFEGIMSRWYNFNEVIQVDIQWCAATAVAGNVRWIGQFENLAEGGQDLDVDGFSAGVNAIQGTNA